MIPAARLAAAIEILADIEARRRPVADALKDWGLSHRFAGSKDRAAIGNIVYDALRWRGSLAFAMGSEAPRALVLGVAGCRWGLGADGLDRLFDGAAHAPEPLTDTERQRIAAFDPQAMPPLARADVPDWTEASLQRAFGEAWVAECEALALRPPLDMRVNRLKAERDKVERALAALAAQPTPHAPDGLRIAATTGAERHPNVQAEPAFQKGWFEIQDEGSQLAALALGAAPGEQVLDLCAGAGGKTLALAATMANRGQIFATDADRQRLAPIFERLKRAGVRNVQVRPAGAALDDLAGLMDRVLVDAPCTGSGTWRRRPDAKWRLTERSLDERVAEQEGLLADAARFVKAGGTLGYVTCSVFPQENADQVARFLERHPDFAAVPSEALMTACGLAEAEAVAVPGGFQMTPRRTGTDGFFVALLQRRQ